MGEDPLYLHVLDDWIKCYYTWKETKETKKHVRNFFLLNRKVRKKSSFHFQNNFLTINHYEEKKSIQEMIERKFWLLWKEHLISFYMCFFILNFNSWVFINIFIIWFICHFIIIWTYFLIYELFYYKL
jgi:hypothetical protein